MITLVPTSGYAFTLKAGERILNHIVSSQWIVTDERNVKELERQMIKYLENPVRESPECKKREKQSSKGWAAGKWKKGIKPKTALPI